MSSSDIQGTKLVELYHRYVGEPESKRDVYGYWLFLLGSIAGLAGVAVFQAEQLLFGANFQLRESAIVLAAAGLALTMFGVLVLLPVRRKGMQASVVGLAIAALGIGAFVWAYPQAWNVQPDYSAPIIAVYSVGLAIIAGVAVLVPIATGEKGLLVEPELGIGEDDNPPILVGDGTEDAFFAVYETPTNDWTWRVIRRDAVGRSATVEPTDTDARMAVDDVRARIGRAGLMELTSAAFRLYRTETNEWRWSLVEADGSLVATNDQPVDTRDEMESTVNFLKEEAPDAEVVEIRGAAFDVYEESGRWQWRLVDGARQPIAVGPDDYQEASEAEAATKTFADAIEEPRVLALEDLGVELFEADAGWRWRVIDGDDRRLVTAETAHESRRDAEAAATDTTERLGDAAIIQRGVSGYELYPHDEGWRWRLRDEADDLLARNAGGSLDRARARRTAERTRDGVGDADIFSFEGADYEVYPAEGSWHWRLVADDRTVLADSTEPFGSRTAAEDAAERVREQALAADLIEFEQAAFQQYESGGEWRWRLIDEDGQVMADSGEQYASKQDVMEGMTTLKEHAPDAEVLEIETAAFEIHQTDDGGYAWRLIDEGGKLIAEAAETHPSRDAARDSVEFVLSTVDDADLRTMEAAAFQLRAEGDSWEFELVDPDGTVLASGTDDYPTRDDAVDAVEAVKAAGDGADIDALAAVTVQLLGDGDDWRFRLIDRKRESLANGERTYADREAALDDIERLRAGAGDAPTFDIGDGIVWVDHTDEGWRWRLVDDERTTLAASPDRFPEREAAMDAVDTVRSVAPEAGQLDIDTLAFELYHEDDETENDDTEASAPVWRWRLIDEDEHALAVGGASYQDREAAEDAIEAARETVARSSIIEIDEVAFEFHEQEDGWGWRLVDEHGEPLAESVEPHPTRQAAREEMLTVKEHAPDGETVVTW